MALAGSGILAIVVGAMANNGSILEEGLICGRHRIERLMRQDVLKTPTKRRGKHGDDGKRSVVADNILDRDFEAEGPNRKWLAGLTYIPTAEGWLHVAIALGLFSRGVFARSMKAERTNRKVCRTRNEPRAELFDGIERFRNPPGGIRNWANSAPWSSKPAPCSFEPLSTKPTAGHNGGTGKWNGRPSLNQAARGRTRRASCPRSATGRPAEPRPQGRGLSAR